MKAKKLTAVILTVLIFLIPVTSITSFAASNSDVINPSNEFFVSDFANVINSSDKSEIMSIATDLYHRTTAQIVVATVKSLNGRNIEEFALELGRQWGIGSKDKNNGVLILLSVDDREITVEVGYGLEGALTDSMCGRFIDKYAIPYLKNNNYSLGLKELFKAVAAVIYDEYGISAQENLSVNIADDGYEEISPLSLLAGIIIIVIILVICRIFHIPIFRIFWYMFLSGGNNHRGGGSSRGGGFHGGGGSFGGGGASRRF